MTLGEKIKQYRQDAELTQEQLAGLLGKGKSYICKIENDQRMTPIPEAIRIADALGVTIQDLVSKDVEIEPSEADYLKAIRKLRKEDPEKLRIVRELLGIEANKKESASGSSKAVG